jgi:hypothetical protein
MNLYIAVRLTQIQGPDFTWYPADAHITVGTYKLPRDYPADLDTMVSVGRRMVHIWNKAGAYMRLVDNLDFCIYGQVVGRHCGVQTGSDWSPLFPAPPVAPRRAEPV